MDSKFNVSLEAAKLLKEKGYDRECVAYYQYERFHPYSINIFGLKTYNKNDAPSYMNQYSAPTKAEAIDWLDSKGIIIEIFQDYRKLWFYVIKRSETESYVSEADDKYFSTRLEAEEAAIIKACKLLENGN